MARTRSCLPPERPSTRFGRQLSAGTGRPYVHISVGKKVLRGFAFNAGPLQVGRKSAAACLALRRIYQQHTGRGTLEAKDRKARTCQNSRGNSLVFKCYSVLLGRRECCDIGCSDKVMPWSSWRACASGIFPIRPPPGHYVSLSPRKFSYFFFANTCVPTNAFAPSFEGLLASGLPAIAPTTVTRNATRA